MSQLKLIDEVVVAETPELRRIQFCLGDLSILDVEDEVDLLVVSAFPGAYDPIPGSLIGDLSKAGVSLDKLSLQIAVDLRNSFSCWISHPIMNKPPSIHFKRVLCYEPLDRGEPYQLVGDIFRSLAPFVGDIPPIKTVALPLVAAGYQGASPIEMLKLITEAAVHWMSIGLPLSCVRIVYKPDTRPEVLHTQTYNSRWNRERLLDGWRYGSDHQNILPSRRLRYQGPVNLQELRATFQLSTTGLTKDVSNTNGNPQHDIFLSYAHKDQKETDWLLERLFEEKPDVKVFFDRKAMTPGTAWQQGIFEALDNCRKVVTLYSPSYLASKVCLEEFNIALCRNRESKEKVLLPIYLYMCQLPTYMKLLQYSDCREFDLSKIQSVCHDLIREINKQGS